MAMIAVGARMNHESATANVGKREPRHQDWNGGGAVPFDDQVRQIAEMAGTAGPFVAACLLRIEMSAGGPGRDQLAVALGRAAVRILGDMGGLRPGTSP